MRNLDITMLLDETIQEVDLETSTEDTDEDIETDTEIEEEKGVEYWKAEALKNKAILERNRAKKENHAEIKKENKSDDFGYDVKAYLKASGIKADEFDFVKKELKNFGGTVDDLIENDYFQAKLEKERKIKETAEAIPKSRRSGTPSTDSVDYWLTKPFEEVPQNMRSKVVNARIEKEKKGVKFYNS